jgi:hypothetical protein
MTLLAPAGNGKRDQSCSAKGQLKGFAQLISDLINAIDPIPTTSQEPKWGLLDKSGITRPPGNDAPFTVQHDRRRVPRRPSSE